jgi:hypothetical protein
VAVTLPARPLMSSSGSHYRVGDHSLAVVAQDKAQIQSASRGLDRDSQIIKGNGEAALRP